MKYIYRICKVILFYLYFQLTKLRHRNIVLCPGHTAGKQWSPNSKSGISLWNPWPWPLCCKETKPTSKSKVELIHCGYAGSLGLWDRDGHMCCSLITQSLKPVGLIKSCHQITVFPGTNDATCLVKKNLQQPVWLGIFGACCLLPGVFSSSHQCWLPI